MRITRLLVIAAVSAAPAVAFATPASAQTAPPYYQQTVNATEVAADLRADTAKAFTKLSAKSLLRGTKTIKITTNAAGKYEIKLTRKVKGKTVTLGSGTKTVKTDNSTSTSIKFKLTAKGKALLKQLKASKIKLSLESSFTPKGAKKKTSKKSLSLKKG